MDLWLDPEGSYELRSVYPFTQKFSYNGSLVFSGTQHGVRGPCSVVRHKTGLFESNIFTQKLEQKFLRFLNLLDNLVFNCFLILACNESAYYLLYSCANPIFGEDLVPEIWAKMLLANHIAVFLNQIDFF